MDLAYLQTGISGVCFGGFEFLESVFFGVLVTAAVFFWVVKYFRVFHISNNSFGFSFIHQSLFMVLH